MLDCCRALVPVVTGGLPTIDKLRVGKLPRMHGSVGSRNAVDKRYYRKTWRGNSYILIVESSSSKSASWVGSSSCQYLS